MKNKITPGILVVASLLILTIITVNVLVVSAFFSNSDSQEDSEKLFEKQAALKLVPLAELSEEQAIAIANTAVKNMDVGRMTDIELERENGVVVYAIEFTKNGIETDVKLDAVTGVVLEIKSDLDDEDEEENEDEGEEHEDDDDDVPITGNALEQASSAALKYIGEGKVTDTEVGDEEGYYEIEITLDNGREVDVHLDKDFNVLSTEYEDDDDDE